jgi:outer membrane protein OmpA-like peptidoglycan-associated protein
MGEPINTRKNEIYPFNDKGIFYFSSDGHAGLGGFDTYKLEYEKRKKIISNLGYPINSSWDDFSIYIEDDHGFISSNDPKGKGEDDIYEFQLLPRPKVIDSVQVNLSILDNLNDYAVDSAVIQIISDLDTAHYISDENGTVTDKFMPGSYTVNVEKVPYVNYSFVIHVEEGDNLKQMVRLEPAIALHTVSPDSIIFKFGEYTLLEIAEIELDDIVKTMNDYPELQLEVSAHTDSRGTHEFNLWLSERRAETAANYIISQGIDSARVHEKGYGETRLLNNCRDGIRCSDKLHDVNRRIEFDFKRKEDTE